MKLVLLLLLVSLCLATDNSTASVYTEEELELNKDFIGCQNLGRVSTTERYNEILQKEIDFNASNYTGLNRYMAEVTDRCLKLTTAEQKQTLFNQFKGGEWLPKNPDIGEDVVPDPSDIFKTAEDFAVPQELEDTNAKVNDPSLKFRHTFDKFKDAKLKQAKANRKLGIMGADLNDSGLVIKALYVLILVVVLGATIFLVSKVLNPKDDINPKHMPQKSRKDRKKNK